MEKLAQATASGARQAYRKGDRSKPHILPAYLGLFGKQVTGVLGDPAIHLSFRVEGKDVTVSDLNLQQRLSGVGRRVVVFVHGLMSNELIWQMPSKETQGYGPRLATETGLTVLYVRYNTGTHISLSGRQLSNLLDELSVCYPLIESLTLIGHSMGGLVIRSAGYYGVQLNHQWTRKLEKVFLLGTPATGASLEKLSHLTAKILRKVPNYPTRLVGRVIDSRSDGIKDLRLGLMVDEDWQHARSDAVLYNFRTKISPLPHTKYYVFIGTLAKNVDSLLAVYFGDGMVSKISATGGSFFGLGSKDPLSEVGMYRVFPKTNHIKMVFSNEVFQAIKELL